MIHPWKFSCRINVSSVAACIFIVLFYGLLFYGRGRFFDPAALNPTSNWVFLIYSLKVGSMRSTMRNKAGHSIRP